MDAKTVKDLMARAGRALGTTVKIIERRGGAGVITINFDTRNQLNEIVDKIAGRNA